MGMDAQIMARHGSRLESSVVWRRLPVSFRMRSLLRLLSVRKMATIMQLGRGPLGVSVL